MEYDPTIPLCVCGHHYESHQRTNTGVGRECLAKGCFNYKGPNTNRCLYYKADWDNFNPPRDDDGPNDNPLFPPPRPYVMNQVHESVAANQKSRLRRLATKIIAGNIMRDLINEMISRISPGKQVTVAQKLPPENPMSFVGILDDLGIDYDPEDLKEDLTLEENKSNEVSTVTPIPLNEIQEKLIDA